MISDAVLISIVTGVASTITATTAAYFAFKAKQTSSRTHILFNSRMNELLALTGTSEFAKGVAQEKKDQLERT